MRSAEQSGVEGEGFGTRYRPFSRLTSSIAQLSRPGRRLIAKVSPITIAIGITALLGASLYVIADAARVLEEAQSHPTTQISAARAGSGIEMVGLAGNALPRVQSIWGADSLLLRGGVAFGLAFALIALTFRRRGVAGLAGNSSLHSYQDLLGTIPFGVACWTDEGKLAACNAQYRERLRDTASDVRPGASYEAAVKRLVEGGYVQVISEDLGNRVLELHREDGSCLLIDERPLAEGGFVTLVTDITERRRTDHLLTSIREEQRLLARRYHEEKLRAEAASRAKTAFLAHLSHDIRTPLNHIIGFAELIRQQTYGPLGDARYLNYVDAVKGSGERLLSFFASIMELAELESGRRVLKTERLSVDDLLVTVTRRFSAQAARAGLTLALGAPSDSVIAADRFSLERMLGNLVDNAIRFNRHGGRVNISAYAADDGVVLEITDTGIGIPEERLQTLSQAFAFGDAALTRDHTGAGLGIAIARAIAELSGGHLAIDSRVNLGTTVAVSLPLNAGEDRLESAA